MRAFFAANAPDISVIVTEVSSTTVTLAAEAHGVQPTQIAKTLCLRVGEPTMPIVTSGTARLDNRKFKDRFGGKARMLDADQVLEATSHPVGGVCRLACRRRCRPTATSPSRLSMRSCQPRVRRMPQCD